MSMFDHMEEAWSLDHNPFTQAAVSAGPEPWSGDVYPQELADFQQKVVRGALQGNRQMTFLWSQGAGNDTGYGKTRLMRHTVDEINKPDWGEAVQLGTGMRLERTTRIAAAFSELNTNLRTGLYPVLFNAVLGMATGADAPLRRAHAEIANAIETRAAIAPTSDPLRGDVLAAFCQGPDELYAHLATCSPTLQLRSGIEFLHFALIALRAAGVEKLFLMIDQLEDLATNKALAASKRRREIGRIRDLLETQPFAGMLHQTFTFHATAARELETFWEQNRLPTYEAKPANQSAVVVLRGLRDDEQVAALLAAWMEPHRTRDVEDELLPFDRGALTVLRAVAQGRLGPLLSRANELLDAGALQQLGRIDGDFARDHFAGSTLLASDGEQEEDYAADVEDLLA
jgi:hypothetical protein